MVDSLGVAATVVPPPLWHNFGATAFTPASTVGLVVALVLYLVGARRVGRTDPEAPWSRRRTAAFVAGLAVTFVAVDLFIGAYDDVLFFDHMIQHLLLVMVAAGLLAMGAPVELLSRATTGPTHRVVRRVLSSKVAEVVGHPASGFLLYAVLIPATHLTSLYNYDITHGAAQDVEQLAFLAVGYLFWRPVVGIEPSRHPLSPGLRLVYLMLSVPIDTFTGMVLVFSGHELFPAYNAIHRSWPPSLLSDLHAGGTVMWIGGDALMVLAMIPVVVGWVRYEDERAAWLDAQLDAQMAGSDEAPIDPNRLPGDR